MSCDCCQMTTFQVFRNETLWLGLDLHTDHLTEPQTERNHNKEKEEKDIIIILNTDLQNLKTS